MVVSISTITGVARNYVEIFFRRKWLFIVPTVLISGLAVAYSFTIPPMFKTSAIVLIEEEKVSNPLISGFTISSTVSGRLVSIVKILLSRPVLDKVVSELNLASYGLDTKEYEGLINAIRDSVSVNLLGGNILKISNENEDPIMCQKIVNSLTQLFIEHNLELQMRETNSGIEFLEHQREIYAQKLRESEGSLRKFKELFQDGLSVKTSRKVSELVGAPQSMMNVDLLRFTEFKEDLLQLNLQLQELTKRKEELSRQFLQEEEYIVSERNVDPSVIGLKKELANKQVELATLEADATGEHPLVKRAQQQIEELKEAIKKKRSETVSSSDKETLNPMYQNIKIELNNANMQIASLKKRVQLTELYVGDYKERIKSIPKKEAELDELQRDYGINSAMYTDLTKRLETAYLTRRLELQEKGTRFKIVDPAVVPRTPFKPNRQFLGLAGMILGMGMGVGLIFMAEMTDHSFIEINQLRNFLNIPVLASISQILTIEEAEEIKARKRLGVLFLFVFVIFVVLGGIAKFILLKSG
ncbi:MAG: XrtA system polysaccharide chain length determinant [Candidatus Omnitrophota bacterium]